MARLSTLVLGLVLLLTAACGAPEPAASPTDTGAPATGSGTGSPTADPSPTASPTASPGDGGTEGSSPEKTEPEGEPGRDEVVTYLVRAHDSGLWVEPVTVHLDEPTVAVARAAMEALLAGETADPNLTTLAPEGTELLDIAVSDGILTVDLSEEVLDGSNVGSAGEEAFAQQLAHTGAHFSTVEAVRLWVEGEPVDELWGHLDWSQPLEADRFALSPIYFTSHSWGEQVDTGEVTVGGRACTFEATVELRLVAPDGSVAEETFTTATSACPEGGTWEHTFTLGTAGTWTIEAIEPDPSGGEGRPPLVTPLELEAS